MTLKRKNTKSVCKSLPNRNKTFSLVLKVEELIFKFLYPSQNIYKDRYCISAASMFHSSNVFFSQDKNIRLSKKFYRFTFYA